MKGIKLKALLCCVALVSLFGCGSQSGNEESLSIFGLWKTKDSPPAEGYLYIEKDKGTTYLPSHMSYCAYAAEVPLEINESDGIVSRMSTNGDGKVDLDYEVHGNQLLLNDTQYVATTFENPEMDWCYDPSLKGSLNLELKLAPNNDTYENLRSSNLDVSIYLDVNGNATHDNGDFHIRLIGFDVKAMHATVYQYFGDNHRAILYSPMMMFQDQTMSVEIPRHVHYLFDQLSAGLPVRVESLNGESGCLDTVPDHNGYIELPLIKYSDQINDVGVAYGSVDCPREKPLLDLIEVSITVSND